MRRILVLAAVSLFVSLSVTALVFLVTRSDRFRAAVEGPFDEPLDAPAVEEVPG